MNLQELLEISRGDKPGSLLLRNANLINVYSGEIYLTDILIQGSYVAAIGTGYAAESEIDLQGRYVAPGLIDAHVHIESSLCTPPEFSRAVLPHGVTTVITDPHEIANVLGLEGIRFMLERAKHGPLNMYVMASSCVPATHMGTSGATLEAEDLQGLLDNPWVPGLAEVMNYPGVVHGDKSVVDKLNLFREKVIDGHAPGLSGHGLNAYAAARIGSDHECTTFEEAREKLRLGLSIFIREGTATPNLDALLPLVNERTYPQICFCTDDRIPSSLIEGGSIDMMIRRTMEYGIDPVTAFRMGTLNTARYFGLRDIGAIAPGKRADLIVISDLAKMHIDITLRGGVLVAQDGITVAPRLPLRKFDLRDTMNVRGDSLDFRIAAAGSRIRVIGYIRDQIVTEHLQDVARISEGEVVADPERDLLKMAVIERHRATGRIGLGFIRGFGLKSGAIAGTVAHDHHNLIVIGADDASMAMAASAVMAQGGGIAAVAQGHVQATLPLPVAGLMSEEPIDKVREQYDTLVACAHSLGSTIGDPLIAMGFMGLEVIPSLKLTDRGLVDVDRFETVSLFVD